MWNNLNKKYDNNSVYKEFKDITQKIKSHLNKRFLPCFNQNLIDQTKLREMMKDIEKRRLSLPLLHWKKMYKDCDQFLFQVQKKYKNTEYKVLRRTRILFSNHPLINQTLSISKFIKKSEIYSKISHFLRYTGSPATVSILAINSLIFGLWQIATPKSYNPYTGQAFNQSLISYEFLKNNFVTSWDYITRGKLHTTILANFSHFDTKHFFFNMITTFFAGRAFEDLFGARVLVISYLVCGIFSMIVQSFFLNTQNNPYIPILGASGSMSAIMTILAIRYPHMQVLLYGIIPVPLYLIVGAFFCFEFFGSRYFHDKNAHEGHLAGMIGGAILYLLKYRKF